MSIKITGLRKRYAEGKCLKDVLNGVTLDVRPGTIFALMGANGAGKTTLVKILATLVLPDAGHIEIGGRDAVNDPGAVRQMTGIVFEPERSFYQALTVEDNLRFFGSLYGVAGTQRDLRIQRLLADFKLEPWRTTRFYHCSSGIRQKLAIVRALLGDPKVLLIDELSRSLDETSAEEAAAAIRRTVTGGNKTCIMVTHSRQLAQRMGCRVGVLKNGIIEEEGL